MLLPANGQLELKKACDLMKQLSACSRREIIFWAKIDPRLAKLAAPSEILGYSLEYILGLPDLQLLSLPSWCSPLEADKGNLGESLPAHSHRILKLRRHY